MRSITILVLAMLTAACSGDDGSYSPTAPTTPVVPPAPPTNSSLWRGDATFVSCSGAECSSTSYTTGFARSGVDWQVTLSGSAIQLLEDAYDFMDAILYSGTLENGHFVASFHCQPGCIYPREGRIEGEFAAGLSSFEARHVLIYGAPHSETRVELQWRFSRM